MLTRPGDETARPETVCPGLHRLGDGQESAFDVVWWDPRALNLESEAPFGLRRQELISKDVAQEVVAGRERDYVAWRNTRSAALASGRAPALLVRTATEWAASPEGDDELARAVEARTVEVIALESDPRRPSGPRYGSLVHASLAEVPLDADEALVVRVVGTQGRMAGATDEEVAAAVEVVRRVLAHPVYEAARIAHLRGTCYRETPLTITAGSTLIEGAADLAFETDEGMVVVDFKTDRAEDERLDQYRRQVGLYAEAISRAIGRPSRAVLMKI